jgi:hypothetical protein
MVIHQNNTFQFSLDEEEAAMICMIMGSISGYGPIRAFGDEIYDALKNITKPDKRKFYHSLITKPMNVILKISRP